MGYFSDSYQRKLSKFKSSPFTKAGRVKIREHIVAVAARRSKRYTTSRRKVRMKQSARERMEKGIKVTEPSCLCGMCRICQGRKRTIRYKEMRKEDKGKFYWNQFGEGEKMDRFDLEVADRIKMIGRKY